MRVHVVFLFCAGVGMVGGSLPGTYAFGRGQVAKWLKQSLSELMADDFLSLVIIQENSGFDDMVDRFSKVRHACAS